MPARARWSPPATSPPSSAARRTSHGPTATACNPDLDVWNSGQRQADVLLRRRAGAPVRRRGLTTGAVPVRTRPPSSSRARTWSSTLRSRASSAARCGLAGSLETEHLSGPTPQEGQGQEGRRPGVDRLPERQAPVLGDVHGDAADDEHAPRPRRSRARPPAASKQQHGSPFPRRAETLGSPRGACRLRACARERLRRPRSALRAAPRAQTRSASARTPTTSAIPITIDCSSAITRPAIDWSVDGERPQ